jgi:hypothetical protein
VEQHDRGDGEAADAVEAGLVADARGRRHPEEVVDLAAAHPPTLPDHSHDVPAWRT